ncbi:MarR family winged helix-turn-helix transcriptional regulator [Shimazuella alba]|uniref:MarR family transcriptional regulator n=1 Tax=Shimazuella alba TaxID=2690964 RepID=A0A6I4VL86_9BACL|nr:MarR family transcriptional regulator [Shimazuella alba]MXQ52339.1 MarR family transcriptional regulator [Shimazuella alba]
MDKKHFPYKFVDFLISVHQITDKITKDVKPEGLTPVQFKILEYVAANSPTTLSQLSDCLHMPLPNTSRELKKLEEKKLCKKESGVEDRRKQYICLSENGEALMQEIFKKVESKFLDRLKDDSQKDLEEIDNALKLLYTKVFYSNHTT